MDLMPPKRPLYFTWMIVGTLLATLAAFLFPLAPPVHAETTCVGNFISVSPALTDLGTGEYIRLNDGPTGHIGGLYPGGINVPPAGHQAAALSLAGQVTPLNAQGNPDPANGAIGMISIGMSNTRSEFNAFMTEVNNAANINPKLEIVNGAQSNRTSTQWALLDPDPLRNPWPLLEEWIEDEG